MISRDPSLCKFNLEGSLPLMLTHTCALKTYLSGGLFTLQNKVIRYGIFQHKVKCLYFSLTHPICKKDFVGESLKNSLFYLYCIFPP